MIRTSYLRVYQEVSEFPVEEAAPWLSETSDPDGGGDPVARSWLVSAALPPSMVTSAEGAFVRRLGEAVMVCPWRTRMRMLSGLLAFRESIPDEIADAFVPETEARRAAHELAKLGEQNPRLRSHILHANWHVPLRWFAAFDKSERVLVEDRQGLRIRYETTLPDARARIRRALEILEDSWGEDEVTDVMRELGEWLDSFGSAGLLELDYGSVAGLFSHDDLVEDQSAEQVWACLEALDAGDLLRAGRLFTGLTEKWAAARASEVVN